MTAPDKLVLVPVEPTEEMKRAAFGPIMDGGRNGPVTSDYLRREGALVFWKAMVAAAPSAPAAPDPMRTEGMETTEKEWASAIAEAERVIPVSHPASAGVTVYADFLLRAKRDFDRLLRQSSEAAVVEWLRRTAHEAGWSSETRHFLEQFATTIERRDHLPPSLPPEER